MNAVIKTSPCPCCEEKDRQIEAHAHALDVANRMVVVRDARLADKDREIAQLESIIRYADVRTADLILNGQREKAEYTGPERRHALRVKRDAEKAAR